MKTLKIILTGLVLMAVLVLLSETALAGPYLRADRVGAGPGYRRGYSAPAGYRRGYYGGRVARRPSFRRPQVIVERGRRDYRYPDHYRHRGHYGYRRDWTDWVGFGMGLADWGLDIADRIIYRYDRPAILGSRYYYREPDYPVVVERPSVVVERPPVVRYAPPIVQREVRVPVVIVPQRGRGDELAELLYRLKSRDEDDRENAVKKLAKFPFDCRVREILERVLLSDPDSEVREEAAKSLGKIKNPRALPALREAGRNDPDDDVREEAKEAIGEIELSNPLLLLQSGEKKDRKEAVKKLAKLPRSGFVIKTLGMVLLSDLEPDVRKEAAKQLGGLKDTDALPFLERAMRDPVKDVRKEAKKAVERIEEAYRAARRR